MDSMNIIVQNMYQKHIIPNNHGASDYFAVISEFVRRRGAGPKDSREYQFWQDEIDKVYALVEDELLVNPGRPVRPVSFGTSGWRGIIGKDLFVKSVCQVTQAIVDLYRDLPGPVDLAGALGVSSLAEARQRGVVVGFDNRFGGALLARNLVDVLTANGFTVHYAGEASTGTLSAAVLRLEAACSINLTPSHNPLDYAGFKFNAADAGPAAPVITSAITAGAREIMAADQALNRQGDPGLVNEIDALELWIDLVRSGRERHGLDYDRIMYDFSRADDLVVAVDCVHGASRVQVNSLFRWPDTDRLILFRADSDPTFGGIAPEPSTANLKMVTQALRDRPEPLKLGVIMDPDADRVRFTDGTTEITMNHFGAMSYHYLHEIKHRQGLVAKTVATSNFANRLAAAFHEEVFEPRVGFKEFKPVIGRALVCFEESDGITVISHTPEKDAYIGLLLALDMVLTLGRNLGEYLRELEEEYGYFYPARDAVAVSRQGAELEAALTGLEKYGPGGTITVGEARKKISEVITIDGRKMILEDGSWLMIRPSGTEPKVRFYVEATSEERKDALFEAAREMLRSIGLLKE